MGWKPLNDLNLCVTAKSMLLYWRHMDLSVENGWKTEWGVGYRSCVAASILDMDSIG